MENSFTTPEHDNLPKKKPPVYSHLDKKQDNPMSPFKVPSALGKRSLSFRESIDFEGESLGIHDAIERESLGILNIKSLVNRESIAQFNKVDLEIESLGFPRESLGFPRESLGFPRESLGFARESLGFPRESLGFPRESLGFPRESLGFRESLAIGKESLGIINLNKMEKDCLENGRESILNTSFFLNISEYGKESLGILDLKDRRESIFNLTDFGKESLGILNFKALESNSVVENKSIPEILFSTVTNDTSDIKISSFDKGFLAPNDRKMSACLSTSSGNPSFDSKKFEGPSKIYSVSSNSSDMSNILNVAALHTTNGLNTAFKYSSDVSCVDLSCSNDFRQRVQSLPLQVEKKIVANNEIKPVEVDKKNFKQFWSCGKPKKKSFKRISFHGVLDFEEDGNEFNDSVFIEGSHFAEKLADGSIYDNSFRDDSLDSIQPPEWPEELNDELKEKSTEKCDTETIFKTVDKILPVPIPVENIKIRNNSAKSCQTTDCDSETADENANTAPNIDNIIKSRDAKELLENLSEILSQEHRSSNQKLQGRNLLFSLADILLCDKSQNLEDSGHSSIGDKPEYMEQLQKRTKSLSDNLKSDQVNKFVSENKRLSQSLSVNNKQTTGETSQKRNNSEVDCSKNITAGSRTSLLSNDSKNASGSVKLSFSKNTSVATKKGPLKATIPVNNMAKKGPTFVTPKKSDQNFIQSKRTSTPIHEPRLIPMAQSTPTGKTVLSKLPKQRSTFTSPLAKPVTSYVSKPKVPSSSPTLSKTSSKLSRHSSASDIKKNYYNSPIRRSFSVGKETGLMSALSKVRQNIVKKLNVDNNKQPEKSGIGENRLSGIAKPKMIVKTNVAGKENVKS